MKKAKHILQIEVKHDRLSFILEFFNSIRFIKKVKVIESSQAHDDFQLTDYMKSEIDKGLKDIEEGKVIPYEQVRKELKKRIKHYKKNPNQTLDFDKAMDDIEKDL